MAALHSFRTRPLILSSPLALCGLIFTRSFLCRNIDLFHLRMGPWAFVWYVCVCNRCKLFVELSVWGYLILCVCHSSRYHLP